MPRSGPTLRTLRTAVGVLGAGALMTLGSAPCAMADGSGTGLVLNVSPVDGVKPGSTFDAPATFGTTGAKALDKVYAWYYVTRGLDFADVPSNCVRWDIGEYDELPPRTLLTCEFDQTVEPGVVYAPDKLPIKALDKALHDRLTVELWDYEYPGGDEYAHRPVRGTAPASKLVERPGAVLSGSGSEGHAAARVWVNAVNTADYQVSGTELKGRVGDTVDVNVKFTNAGPAWVVICTVELPRRSLFLKSAGTTVVKG
ncbi:hypothetical protein ACFV09_42740, partial [Streptomyces sp. NPDC059631]